VSAYSREERWAIDLADATCPFPPLQPTFYHSGELYVHPGWPVNVFLMP